MLTYFSSARFTQLQHYSFKERNEILAIAASLLTTPEKLILNLVKLCLLTPAFLLLANWQNSWFFLLAVVVLLTFFIVMRPITLYFCSRHLIKALEQFQRNKH